MASELKTNPSGASVEDLLGAIDDTSRRADARMLLDIMRSVTGEEPVVWGEKMIGFGSYHYRYASGHEGDWFLTGFAPRKNDLSLYIMAGFDRFPDLMSRLGKFKTGKSCLYIKHLQDVDADVLRSLIEASVDHMVKTYGRTS